MRRPAPAPSFRLGVPEDWLLQEDGGAVTVVREPSTAGAFAANVNVVCCQREPDVDLAAIVEAASEGMSGVLIDYVELDREVGDEGRLLITYRQGPTELMAAQRYVLAGVTSFVVTATATSEDWATREAVFTGLVDSFEAT